MKFIKKNKIKIILLIFLIATILFGYFVYTVFFPDNTNDYYGNRLIDISNHKVNNDTYEKLKTELSEKDEVKSVEIKTSGKIINIILRIEKDVNIEIAKMLDSEVLVAFTKEQRDYYDLQLFLTTEEKKEGYPTIGYKHHTSEEFVWTNNDVQEIE